MLCVEIVVWDACRQENVLTDGEGEGSGEECEITDECAMLLNAEGGSTLHKVLKASAAAHKHGMPVVASSNYTIFLAVCDVCVLFAL